MRHVVLGPQASPPARVQINQGYSYEPLQESELVLLNAGKRGPLQSQDDDHFASCGNGNDAAAICAISSNMGGVGETAVSASRNIVLQNGQAVPTMSAPVADNFFTLLWLTRSPVSSPKNAKPPPAPQQKLRSRVRGGSMILPHRPSTSHGSSYVPRYRPRKQGS